MWIHGQEFAVVVNQFGLKNTYFSLPFMISAAAM